ncbi:MAG: 2-oxoacid:acceptor oxidoreductase subunit alpha [Candidatus Omnitrophica bacterium]|nr:2-oxoacid:acceptor oxidoreductase subunit alpha [Candidatus Omnitrophota bacterium]
MSKKEISIRITGEAGQGMKTIGHAVGEMFVKAGFNIFSNMDYMSRIRGGNNFYQIRISSRPVETLRENPDMIIALNAESVGLHRSALSDEGVLFLDREKFELEEEDGSFRDAPLYGIAGEAGSEIYVNSASCGLIAGMTGIDFSHLKEVFGKVFAAKDEEVLKKNIDAAKKGYELASEKFKDDIFSVECEECAGDLLLNGNEAIALAAVKSGCSFYSAYPMTPATSIMVAMAGYSEQLDILVEQAEDEIAAINMAIGASFAGARSMTATSGGGFALMTEGVSLAGMTETPVVIVDAQRPAPATGLPTRTEQSDLDFVLYGAHGEFAKAVFAPGTIEECFFLTMKAFELADKYQMPVIILTDQHLADSMRNIEKLDGRGIKVRKFSLSREDSKKIEDYQRYALTDDGISPRAVPSWIKDVIYADSDEHDQKGHITESDEVRDSMVEKRFFKKMENLRKEVVPPTVLAVEEAETLLVGFGSTYGVMKEACKAKGKSFGMVHIPQVWPFPAEEVTGALEKAKKVICLENNASGQLAALIRKATGIRVSEHILKYDGRPFNADQLTEQL